MNRLLAYQAQRRCHAAQWERELGAPGVIFESCSLHPCEVVELDVWGDDITGKSILDGSIQSCSLSHCGVCAMKPDQVKRAKEAWAREGERGLLTIYTGSDAAADQFLKDWR